MGYVDYSGWMRSVEEVDPQPDVELQALGKLVHLIDDPEEFLYVAKILGIDHHLSDLRKLLRTESKRV